MTVYESEEHRLSDPEDAERFEASISALAGAGIFVERIVCASPSDIDEQEASEIVSESGMSALPITVYQGVVLTTGEYPSDQDLADFLDVPDGTLSVDRAKPPAMGNDLPPACACGNRTK